jgi:PAS domain S-box-containing protein
MYDKCAVNQPAANSPLSAFELLGLLDLMPAAVYTCEAPSGLITYFNRRAAEIWGREPLIGDTDERFCGSFCLYRPDGHLLPHPETPMAKVINGGPPVRNQEVLIERPDGSRISVMVNIDPIKNSDGEITGAINVFQDITEQKRLFEALRRSEQLYKAIGDSIPYGIWVCDAEGRNAYTSESLLRLIGLSQKQCSEFGWAAALNPYEAKATLAAWKKCVQNGQPWEREHRFKGVDGRWHPVLARGVPIKDDFGKIMAWVGINLDIADFVRTRELARQRGEMLEQTHDATFQFELHGGIIYWTRGAKNLYGFTEEETLGRVPWELLKTNCPGGIRSVMLELERDGSWNGELQHYTRDGEQVAVESRMLLWRQPEGPPIVVETNHDITDRKRMDQVLRESEQKLKVQAQELEQQLIASGRLVSLGEVTASMAHEFNNPLGIIIGFVEELLASKQPSDPDYRTLQILDEESRRCKKIITDLMEYARPGHAEMSPVAIPEVIEKTLKMVENHLYKQRVQASQAIAVGLPRIHADSQQLAQVLLNLYLNAIDAMPNGGHLTVGAAVEASDGMESSLVITVADTGVGIEADELPKIFQPFYTAKKRRGMGLGLPICQRIIKNHGGAIEVESRKGQGTTFKIHLPVNKGTVPLP